MVEVDAMLIDPSNAGQLQAWDGDEGRFWAAHAAQFEKAVAAYDRHFLEAAAIEAGDRVLDIGCGTGATTRDAARRAAGGWALGVDLSSRMIEVARETAGRQDVHNARFERADAQVHPFADEAFDVAISRTGAMFFGDPAAAFTNIARALRPRGRLVLLVWQSFPRNEWIVGITGALAAGRALPPPPPEVPGPFSLSDPDRVRALLLGAGFTDPRVAALEEPIHFGADADTAHRFLSDFTGWMLEGLDDEGRARARRALRSTVEHHDTGHGVTFGSAAWLVTARRAS